MLLAGRARSPKTIPTLKKLSSSHLIITTILLLRLAGLPPLGGFSVKAARLSILSPSYPIICLILILSSAASLGFYIHVVLLALITSIESLSPQPPYPVKNNFVLAMAVILIRALLPAIPILMF